MTEFARMRNVASRFAPLMIGGITAATLVLTPAAAFGQLGEDSASEVDDQGEDTVEPAEFVPVFGLELDPELENFDLIDPEWLDAEWQDPITRFELADEPLAPAPSFDFWRLHGSDVFEPGIANISVSGGPDLTLEIENHTRALQAVATGELAWETAGEDIASERGSITTNNAAIATNNGKIAETEEELADELAQLQDIEDADSEEVAQQVEFQAGIDEANGAIIELALQVFTGESSELETILTDPGSAAPLERRVLTDQVRDFQRADIESFQEMIRESQQRREQLAEQRASIESENSSRLTLLASLNEQNDSFRARISDSREEIAALQDRRAELEETIALTEAFSEVTALQYQKTYHQRLTSFVSGTDIPLVALNAYVRAVNTLAQEDRSCGIHWSQLAGIGSVESSHGYFGGSTLDVNGNTTVDIFGPPLDGGVLAGPTDGDLPDATDRTEETNGILRLAEIFDTDDGELDGDRIYDRAVGPMQFIPTTWALYEPDGNDDGEVDPQNVYDAALASARYLCDAPGSMLTHDGEQRAYFAYNQDCLLYTSPSPRDQRGSRMPSSA